MYHFAVYFSPVLLQIQVDRFYTLYLKHYTMQVNWSKFYNLKRISGWKENTLYSWRIYVWKWLLWLLTIQHRANSLTTQDFHFSNDKTNKTEYQLPRSTAWWRRWWHPIPVLFPGKSHGWKSLVGCSPQGHEESDTTEQLHFHFSLSCTGEGNGNPLQCSCLENLRDGGAWWAAISGVAQSQTRLKRLSSSSSTAWCLNEKNAF